MIGLFIHHDPLSQPWVMPYFIRRMDVFHGSRMLYVTNGGMFQFFDHAAKYFGIAVNEYPKYDVVSDWIRCHLLLTIPRLLYSDSDVLWYSAPELGYKPLKGDTTFGIMWSGAGLPDAAKEYAFRFARECGMTKNINSNFLIPIGDRMDPKCFYHGKDLNSSPNN